MGLVANRRARRQMKATETPKAEASALAERIANLFGGVLAAGECKTAKEIAEYLRTNEREVRRVIAEEYEAIQRLAGGLLCSKPGDGYWLCNDAEQITERYRLLVMLERQAITKRVSFADAARAFGFGGLIDQLERERAAQ